MLPTFLAAALDADIVHNPRSQQGAGWARLPSLRTRANEERGLSLRHYQVLGLCRTPLLPTRGELLPGATRQLGQQNKEGASIPGAAGLQENYSRPSERRSPLFRFPISVKEEGVRQRAEWTQAAWGRGGQEGWGRSGTAACKYVSVGGGGRSCSDFVVCFLPETTQRVRTAARSRGTPEPSA